MGTFSRLDVPVVFGSLRDRWFAVLKPPGFLAPASPSQPSVEATLRPFVGDRELSFPIRPEKNAQGLLIVATDDSMHRTLDDMVRQRQVRSTYRVLADVSATPTALGNLASSNIVGLPFLSSQRLASGQLQGSLWAFRGDVSASASLAEGMALVRQGVLRSYITARPLRLRATPLTAVQQQSGDGDSSSSGDGTEIVWKNKRVLSDALEGDSVPPQLANVVSKSMLGHSRSPQSNYGSAQLAATEFELLSDAQSGIQVSAFTARFIGPSALCPGVTRPVGAFTHAEDFCAAGTC